jgi:enterochelin esterase-like enzyme
MGPTSIWVLVLVGLGSVALLVGVALLRRIALKIVSGALAMVFCLFGGALIVNDFYGYYTGWGAAVADLTGHGNGYALKVASAAAATDRSIPHGRVVAMSLAGPISGISRTGLVYLPPQYDEPQYRGVRFPVLELLHGSPGDPAVWTLLLHVNGFMDELIARHEIGPMVLVMPDSNRTTKSQDECLDTPGNRDDTYVAQDVPNDVRAALRVSTDPAQWGLFGFSSGGYCAANLMMRHPGAFGAVAAFDGYFDPRQGAAARDLGGDPAAVTANDPLAQVAALSPGSAVPPVWVGAGTGNRADYQAAADFAAELRRVVATTFYAEPKAHHSAGADRTAIPYALIFAWQNLATPDMRLKFPTVAYDASRPLTNAQAPRLGRPAPAALW